MQRISNKNAILALKILLFCLLVYFPIFLHLDKLPIRIWDEARLALSAFEMSVNGNYLITFIKGEPDFWSPKPPFMIWLQVFFIKVIGPGELAIRLPSAIAAFLTAALLIVFSVKYLKSYWFGLIAVLVLVTTNGYINSHATRTGDYDSLLTLFTTAYLLCFYLYLESKKIKFLHFFFLAVTLAILTKSVQGLIFAPALLIYVLIQKQLFIFRNKWLYIDLFLSILVVAAYYLLRELYNPGYLEAVWLSELGGRYLTTLGVHSADFFYYYRELMNYHYSDWFWLVPCGIALGLFSTDIRVRKITLYTAILVLVYFLVISYAKTKLVWYMTPMYPLLAILATIGLYVVFVFLKTSKDLNQHFNIAVLPVVFLFILFLNPYRKIIDKVYFPKEDPWIGNELTFSYYLQELVESDEVIKNKKLAYEGYDIQLRFYTGILNDREQNFEFVDWTTLDPQDTVLAYQQDVVSYIETNYHHDMIYQDGEIRTFFIHERK